MFIGAISIAESFSYFELGILTLTYIVNWGIMSYIIKKISTGEISTDSQLKELTWYGAILLVFMISIILIGSPSSYELIVAAIAFTLIWAIRSAIAKKFAPTNNVSIA